MEVKKKIEEVNAAIAAYEQSGKKASKAGELLNKVLSDKSSGAHNYQKAMALLEEASKNLKQ